MESLKQKTLALFFTCGISLKTWAKVGNLEREIRPYRELAKYFQEIYFFTYGNVRDLEFQRFFPANIKIFPKPGRMPAILYSLLLPFFYRKALKKTDILKTNQMSGSWAAVLAKWFYKKKLVVRCGYEWLRFAEKQSKPFWKKWLIGLAEKIAYRAADKIVLTSRGDKEFIEERFGASPAKIAVIPNYIDTNLFKPLTIAKQVSRIIFIGRLEEQKNLFNLIEAVSHQPVKLVIIGSGPLLEKLERFSKQKQAKVEFLGNVPQKQLPAELNKSQIFVLPSLYEGCPKALLEAMSCGLPCIGANVEGITEVIEQGSNGILCDTQAGSIKQAILYLLQSPDLQQRLGAAARATITARFSLEVAIKKELSLYDYD